MMRIFMVVAGLLSAGNPAWTQFDVNKALQGLGGIAGSSGSGLSDAKNHRRSVLRCGARREKIRTNPAGRVTDLLKEVFGKR
jgi:hypothetical protein